MPFRRSHLLGVLAREIDGNENDSTNGMRNVRQVKIAHVAAAMKDFRGRVDIVSSLSLVVWVLMRGAVVGDGCWMASQYYKCRLGWGILQTIQMKISQLPEIMIPNSFHVVCLYRFSTG